MSEEPDDETDPQSDVMEGLLFDLGIFGDHPAAVGGPRPRSGVLVERTLSAAPMAPAACGAPSSASTGLGLSFGDDPLRELTEKCARHVLGKSLFS